MGYDINFGIRIQATVEGLEDAKRLNEELAKIRGGTPGGAPAKGEEGLLESILKGLGLGGVVKGGKLGTAGLITTGVGEALRLIKNPLAAFKDMWNALGGGILPNVGRGLAAVLRPLWGLGRAVFGVYFAIWRYLLVAFRAIITTGAHVAAVVMGITAALAGLMVAGMGIGTALTVHFAEFEQGMRNAMTVMGLFGEELERTEAIMSAYAQELATITRFTATEITGAFYDIASAGFEAMEVYEMMPAVIAYAQATLSSLEQTVETVSGALRMFGLEASEASRIVNVLAAAIGLSPLTADRLADSLKYAGPVAAIAGMSIEDLTAALMVLSRTMIVGTLAGTGLRYMIIQGIGPTEKTIGILKKYGLSQEALNVHLTGFRQVLENLQKMTPEDIFEIYGVRGAQAVASLAKQGTAQYDEFRQAITDTNYAFQLQALQMQTVQSQWKVLGSRIELLTIAFGYGARGGFMEFLYSLQRVVERLRQSGVMEWLGRVFGGVAQQLGGFLERAQVALGPSVGRIIEQAVSQTTLFMGNLLSWAEANLPRFGRVAETAFTVFWNAAYVAANLVLVAFDKVMEWLDEHGPEIRQWSGEVATWFQAHWGTIGDAIGRALDWIWARIQGFFEWLQDPATAAALQTMWTSILTAVRELGNQLPGIATSLGSLAVTLAENMPQAVEAFQNFTQLIIDNKDTIIGFFETIVNLGGRLTGIWEGISDWAQGFRVALRGPAAIEAPRRAREVGREVGREVARGARESNPPLRPRELWPTWQEWLLGPLGVQHWWFRTLGRTFGPEALGGAPRAGETQPRTASLFGGGTAAGFWPTPGAQMAALGAGGYGSVVQMTLYVNDASQIGAVVQEAFDRQAGQRRRNRVR